MGDQLRINDTLVSSLRVVMRQGNFGLSEAPDIIKRLIHEEAWKEQLIARLALLDTWIREVRDAGA